MIIVSIFLLIVMCFSIYYTNITATKPNGNIILNSTIPAEKLQDAKVLNVIKEFKKANVNMMFLIIILYLPCIFFIKNMFGFLWMFIWIIIAMFMQNIIFKKFFNKMQNIKRENDWFIKRKYEVTIDTEVARLKNTMQVSVFWFSIPLFMNIFSFFINKEKIFSFVSLGMTILCIIMYYIFIKKRTAVYSVESKVNIGCNYIYRRMWSIFWIASASIFSLPAMLAFIDYRYLNILLLVSVMLILALNIFVYSKIRNTKNKLLATSEKIIYCDDDECWGAMFYNNPKDPSLMVEKRYGVGTTLNIGHPKAKYIVIGFTIFMLLVFSPIVYMFGSLASSGIVMKINDETIEINVPMYSTSFNVNDIESIGIINSIPKGVRTNGAATGQFSIGHYKLDEYDGDSLLYIDSNVEDIIKIKLKDRYIFINGNTNDDFKEYYEQLKNKVKGN